MTLGIGVSSPAIVSKVRGIEYGKPYSFMKTYLEAMEGSRSHERRPGRAGAGRARRPGSENA